MGRVMSSASYDSFRSAAELPDRDEDRDPVGPRVVCDHCNLDLGEHPAGAYAHCEECDGAYLAAWPEPARDLTDAEMDEYLAAEAASHEVSQ